MLKRRAGFSLIEVLVAVALVSLMFSVTLPVSYELFQSYRNSLKAQEVLLYLSALRRESFLFSEDKEISSLNGALLVNGETVLFQDVYVEVKRPFKFYKNGTSNGGEVEVRIGKEVFLISVSSPFGELYFERLGRKSPGTG